MPAQALLLVAKLHALAGGLLGATGIARVGIVIRIGWITFVALWLIQAVIISQGMESVREAVADIIEKLTGKRPKRVIDAAAESL